MSKWINKDKFEKFQNKKQKELDSKPAGQSNRAVVWPTPEKGTPERPKVYEGRFIPDQDGNFYEKYYYHMFRLGEKWQFILCEKSFGLDSFCPFCTASSKLYMGTATDKKIAGQFKKKEKFVSNWFVVDDPRDNERDEDKKLNNTVKLYEFPWKVEMKLKEEITNTKHGLGISIFDPEEDGYNFLLKVLATKKDRDGNVWPDYSMSEFTRRSSSLGSDEDIDKIMKSTTKLKEYIASMKRPDDDIKTILEKAMIWDLIESDWNREKTVTTEESDKEPDDDVFYEDNDGQKQGCSDDETDEDLLRELDDI